MLADLTFWQKLWNKGVDIAAGVATSTISAAIVAVIAVLFWSWKKRRDLKQEEDKQRQQHQIAQELDEEDEARKARNRETRLRLELESLVKALAEAGSCGNGALVHNAFVSWQQWLIYNQLQFSPTNQSILATWPMIADKVRYAAVEQHVAQLAEALVSQIKNTDLGQGHIAAPPEGRGTPAIVDLPEAAPLNDTRCKHTPDEC